MRAIRLRMPGETESEARRRLAAEQAALDGVVLTPFDQAEDRQNDALADLRRNNPNLNSKNI